MFLGSRRNIIASGPTAVAFALTASPWVAVYRFNPLSGWGTRYSNPATLPTVSTDARGVAFGTDNAQLLVCGATGGTSGVRIYPWSINSGYGARSLLTFTDPVCVTPTRTGNRMLVSGSAACAEYQFTSSGFGSQVFSVTAGSEIRESAYIWDDKYFVHAMVATLSFRIYSRAATPVILDSRSYFGTPLQFSMSPIVYTGARLLAVSHDGGTAKFYRVKADGTIDTEITSTIGTAVNRMVFDSRGRLIVGRNSNRIDVYTLDSSGNQTLLQTITNASSITFTGGTVIALEYDEDSDILFVGSSGAPFVTAYRMGGAGFVSKFSDPGTSVAVGVRNIALHYNDRFKYAAN